MRQVVIARFLLAVAAMSALPVSAATLVPQTDAARQGLRRAWFAQIGTPDSNGPIAHLNYDHGLLLVQSSRGMIHAVEAETGRKLWSTQAGPIDRACTEPAANEDYVAVVNGSHLYVIDRATGAILWSKPTGAAPGAGPAMSDTHAFVPMVSGAVEGYRFEGGPHQTPWTYRSSGRISVPAMTTPMTLSWTTQGGQFYVADPNAHGIRFRLDSQGAIPARPAHWSPRLFACSDRGYVYAVNEKTGKIDWRYSIGESVLDSPVAVDNKLYVIPQFGGMYCLDGETGDPLWYAAEIKQFISTSPKRVYAVDKIGSMVTLDAASGTQLAAMPLRGITIKLINNDTDRLYLAGDDCVVQCFRELELKEPVIYTPPVVEKELPTLKEKPKKPQGEDEEISDEALTDEAMPDESGEPSEDAAMDADAPAAGDAEDPFGGADPE